MAQDVAFRVFDLGFRIYRVSGAG